MNISELTIDSIFSVMQLKEIIFGEDKKETESDIYWVSGSDEYSKMDEMQIDRLYLCL